VYIIGHFRYDLSSESAALILTIIIKTSKKTTPKNIKYTETQRCEIKVKVKVWTLDIAWLT